MRAPAHLAPVAALCLALVAIPAHADTTGRATVIDGDTIEVRGERIRLDAIDAPESGQTCEVDGQPWRCGQQAALALADKLTANAKWTTFTPPQWTDFTPPLTPGSEIYLEGR